MHLRAPIGFKDPNPLPLQFHFPIEEAKGWSDAASYLSGYLFQIITHGNTRDRSIIVDAQHNGASLGIRHSDEGLYNVAYNLLPWPGKRLTT